MLMCYAKGGLKHHGAEEVDMGGDAAMRDEGPRYSVSELQRRAGRIVQAAREEGPVVITERGKPVGVLVDFAEYRTLADLEAEAEELYWTVVALRQLEEWRRAGEPKIAWADVENRSRG